MTAIFSISVSPPRRLFAAVIVTKSHMSEISPNPRSSLAVISNTLLLHFRFHRPIQGSRLMLSIRALAAKRRRMDIQTLAISSTCRSCCDPMNPLTVPSFGTLPDDDIDIEMSDRPPFNISIPVPDRSNQSSENASEQFGSHQRSRDFDGPGMGDSERNAECEIDHALREQSSCEKREPCRGVEIVCAGHLDSSWENVQKIEVERNPNLAGLTDKNPTGSCRCRWGNVTWLQEWEAV